MASILNLFFPIETNLIKYVHNTNGIVKYLLEGDISDLSTIVVSNAYRFGTKVSILGGAIYYSREVGVWKDSETTYELGKTCVAYLSPYISKLENEVPIPLEIKNLPSREDAYRTVSNYWNKGVISSVAFVECLPSTVISYVSKGVDYISEILQQENTKTLSDKDSS